MIQKSLQCPPYEMKNYVRGKIRAYTETEYRGTPLTPGSGFNDF